MSENTFLFDFDSTLTRLETLPYLAALKGIAPQMEALTQRAMAETIDFEESFRSRAALLGDIPLKDIQIKMRAMPLNPLMAAFIRKNVGRCYIVTGNLDLWVTETVKLVGMQQRLIASHGIETPRGTAVVSVLDKAKVVQKIPRPFVAVGDGSNDIPMLRAADTAIGFSGVRPVCPALEMAAHRVFQNEGALCRFLTALL